MKLSNVHIKIVQENKNCTKKFTNLVLFKRIHFTSPCLTTIYPENNTNTEKRKNRNF